MINTYIKADEPINKYRSRHLPAQLISFIFVRTSTVAVGTIYNRKLISVFFWHIFRKKNTPALCHIWEITKPYALDHYDAKGVRF